MNQKEKEEMEKLKELVKKYDEKNKLEEPSAEVPDIEPAPVKEEPKEEPTGEPLKISPFCENGFYRETLLNILHRIATALEKDKAEAK